MKEKITVNIADVELNFLSDEPQEFVQELAKILDQKIRDLTLKSKRSSKYDAAVFCALDYFSEKVHLERKAKSLEHQVSLYEANNARLRSEIEALKQEQQNMGCQPSQPVSDQVPAQPQNAPLTSPVQESDKEKEETSNRQKLAEIEHLLKTKAKGIASKHD